MIVVPRLVRTLLAMLAGAAVGGLAGLLLTGRGGLAWVGAVLGVAWVVLADALRGRRLVEWLRGSQESAAPRDSGLWGELGFRIERALRVREQQRVREELRLSQFLAAIEASPNGVLLLDANEQIEWCNSVAADHFGLDPVRDRRQRVTNLIRTPAFVSYLQAAHYNEATTLFSPRGDTTLSVLIRPYGEGMRLVLSQDITERLRVEAMRRDFVANVSHEIRTPLTVLSGFIETMSNLPLSEAERVRVLALMTQQADRMHTLVSDLLTLAQLEGSPRPPADRWVGVASLWARAETDAKVLSKGRHQLVFTAADDLHLVGTQVAGSESELFSALTNLVSNAVRYTPEGGRVEVTWQLQPGGSGEIIVRDTGIGIERDQLPRLTERFYRVDGSRSRDTGGTGLGLSIVKHVVQRHGGQLLVDSEPGAGSEFRVVLPPARVRRTGADTEAEPPPAAERSAA
jgi:two-component system, OmpR family, phosphate regulon sensor histidine kinase PhoR